MSKAIDVKFDGLNYRKRISIWWDFTKAILFKRNVKMKYKVPEINVVDRA